MISYFKQHLRVLILVDLVGALTTAAMLYFVWMAFIELVGVPKEVLKIMAIGALSIALTGVCGRWVFNRDYRTVLKVLAVFNVLYCISTMAVLIIYRDTLKTIGLVYFLAEILIILVLATLESVVSMDA